MSKHTRWRLLTSTYFSFQNIVVWVVDPPLPLDIALGHFTHITYQDTNRKPSPQSQPVCQAPVVSASAVYSECHFKNGYPNQKTGRHFYQSMVTYQWPHSCFHQLLTITLDQGWGLLRLSPSLARVLLIHRSSMDNQSCPFSNVDS